MSKPQRSDVKADKPRYDDFQDFKPDFSPKRMVEMGVFNGAYFKDATDENLEGIPDAIAKAQSGPSDKANNMFDSKSGLSFEEWKKKGWIRDQDPLGWFQWFCRFDGGRRTEDDERQIKRWQEFKHRWTPGSKKALNNMDPKDGTRQALLQWGIHPWTPEMAVENDE